MNSKFTITLEIEVKLIINITIVLINNNISIVTFSTLLNDVVFNIATDVLQTGRTNEAVVVI